MEKLKLYILQYNLMIALIQSKSFNHIDFKRKISFSETVGENFTIPPIFPKIKWFAAFVKNM